VSIELHIADIMADIMAEIATTSDELYSKAATSVFIE
jgi:hypothetical protein